MLFDEPVSLVVRYTWFLSLSLLDCRKRGPYLGIWRQNEFKFFAGRTYTRYRNAFHNQSPFRCTLDCREQQSGRLAATLRANFTAKLTLKISRNRRKKSCEIGQFYRAINPKNPAKFVFSSREIPEGLLISGTKKNVLELRDKTYLRNKLKLTYHYILSYIYNSFIVRHKRRIYF